MRQHHLGHRDHEPELLRLSPPAQVPVHVPVGVCGNTISVIGTMNPSFCD
ncbi:chaplin [Streptomyces botrytidirepellens]|uniref:Chaplin n=1 Tax=Streptomyces botrytidirepellens TaxID=2486417 RepID=A0A3M8VRC7_9ACTN|nr:chaplin [Streptomyces botrytidirepellens]